MIKTYFKITALLILLTFIPSQLCLGDVSVLRQSKLAVQAARQRMKPEEDAPGRSVLMTLKSMLIKLMRTAFFGRWGRKSYQVRHPKILSLLRNSQGGLGVTDKSIVQFILILVSFCALVGIRISEYLSVISLSVLPLMIFLFVISFLTGWKEFFRGFNPDAKANIYASLTISAVVAMLAVIWYFALRRFLPDLFLPNLISKIGLNPDLLLLPVDSSNVITKQKSMYIRTDLIFTIVLFAPIVFSISCISGILSAIIKSLKRFDDVSGDNLGSAPHIPGLPPTDTAP